MSHRILNFILLIVALGLVPASAKSQTHRNLLRQYSEQQVAASLIPLEAWKPFPATSAEWASQVPDTVRRRITDEAEKFAVMPFTPIAASLMLEFKLTGNRTRYEDIFFKKREQLFMLVLAESFEKKGRFVKLITDGVWSLCEESFWGVPAHLYLQKAGPGLADVKDPSVDLFAMETGVLLALTHYLVGDQLDSISPLLKTRIYDEVNRRLFIPLEKSAVPYRYLGQGTKEAPVNNWNPWVISNWLTALLILEKDSVRRAKETHHAMLLLDNYINWIGDDGAIDEGPSYWFGAVGRLFDALYILENASAGKLVIYKEPFIRNMGSFIYKMHIAGNYFIPVADASPTISPDGLLLYRMGRCIGDTVLKNFGAWSVKNIDADQPVKMDMARPRMLWNLLALKECALQQGAPPLLRDVWLSSIQLMAARTKNGLYIASHGGHNAESHNHNDVGDFIVYARGQPVIIDVGFGTYTAKTFSKDRYSLWYLSSAYHNLPVISGIQQKEGLQYAARDVVYKKSASAISFSMDLAAAWPKEAGINKWKRTIRVEKDKDRISINDSYDLSKMPAQITQTFMTVCPVKTDVPGKIFFSIAGQKDVVLTYDADAWEVKQEQVSTSAPDEKRIADNWDQRTIWRLLLVSKRAAKLGVYKYRIDG
jgi:hypothetical protein